MSRRAASGVAAGLLAIAGLFGQAVGAAAAVAPPDAAPLGHTVTIKLGGVSPAGLDATDDLVVRGSVRNPGPQITKATLRLRLHGPILDTREDVTSWNAPETGTPSARGTALPGGQKLDEIPASSTVPFTLTVPAGTTGLPDLASAFGPRGLTIELAQGPHTLAALRTTVVWSPASATTKTRLSLLVPITSSVPSTDAGAANAVNAGLIGPDGRLQNVLDASSDVAFDWAIDPAVLQAAARLRATGVTSGSSGTGSTDGTGATPAGSSSPSGSSTSPAASATGAGAPTAQQQISDARSWLTQFSSGSQGRVVLALPYADPDLNSVLDAGESGLLRTADRLGRQFTRAVLGHALDRSVAWPGDGKVSGKTVSGLDRAGRTDVLIASSQQPPKQDLSYTPTGRSTIHSKDHTLDGLLYDEDLSAQLAASGGSTSPSSTQTMLAELAAIGLEHPSVTTHVLAVAPRNWNPDPVRVAGLSAALHAAPWVSLRSIDTLRDADAAETDRDAPVFTPASRLAELPPLVISSIAALNDGLDLFSPIALDPDPGLTVLHERLASLLSVSWRQDPDGLAAARLEVSRPVNRLSNGVRFLTGSSKLFLAKSAPVPVYVDNRTDYDVRVRIELTPKSGQLSLTQPDPVTVKQGRREQVLIKARALAEGDVKIEARLITPAGRQLGATSTFVVRVRPDWETRAMVGAAVVLGLLLVIGLLRGIRRDRTRVPPESVPDVDDLAALNEPQPDEEPEPPEPEPEPPDGGPANDGAPARTGDTGADGKQVIPEPPAPPSPRSTHAIATKENR